MNRERESEKAYKLIGKSNKDLSEAQMIVGLIVFLSIYSDQRTVNP